MSSSPSKPPLGKPHHSGYAVQSIAATVPRLVEQFGAGPFLLIENVPLENVSFNGEPAVFEHHSAFGSLGGYPIELQETVRVDPEHLATKWSGELPRLHHVGYALSSHAADDARDALAEGGSPAYLASELNGEVTTVHDGSLVLGHDIEVLVDGPALQEFFAMVLGAAEGWDGTDPLRSVG